MPESPPTIALSIYVLNGTTCLLMNCKLLILVSLTFFFIKAQELKSHNKIGRK